MKKRLLALTMAGMMVFGGAFSAMATEAQTEAESETIPEVTVDMADFDAYEGTWVNFEAGFSLYLPSDWDVLEVSDEDAENDIIYEVKAPEGSDQNIALVVSATDVGKDCDLQQVFDEVTDSGCEDVQKGIINGISVVAFETDSSYGEAFLDDNGIMYSVQVGPRDEEIVTLAANILSTLRPTETVETEAAAN